MDDIRAVMDAVGSDRATLVRRVRRWADQLAVRGDLSRPRRRDRVVRDVRLLRRRAGPHRCVGAGCAPSSSPSSSSSGTAPVSHCWASGRRGSKSRMSCRSGPRRSGSPTAPAVSGRCIRRCSKPMCTRRCRACRRRASSCTARRCRCSSSRASTSPSTCRTRDWPPSTASITFPGSRASTGSSPRSRSSSPAPARPSSIERVLATLLFTDIVGSTEKAAAMGDRRWHEVIESYYRLVRRCVERFRGVEVSTEGDGFIARFDGPARAVSCATRHPRRRARPRHRDPRRCAHR